MALQKPYELESGIVLSEAYHRVRNASLDRPVEHSGDGTNYDRVTMQMEIFRDSTARQNNNKAAKFYVYDVFAAQDQTGFETYFGMSQLDGTNTNLVGQCYSYLKTKTDVNGMDVSINYTDSTDV
jgi:hypothetical protein